MEMSMSRRRSSPVTIEEGRYYNIDGDDDDCDDYDKL